MVNIVHIKKKTGGGSLCVCVVVVGGVAWGEGGAAAVHMHSCLVPGYEIRRE